MGTPSPTQPSSDSTIRGLISLVLIVIWILGFPIIAFALPTSVIVKVIIGVGWLLAGRGILACFWDLLMLPLAAIGIPIFYATSKFRKGGDGNQDR